MLAADAPAPITSAGHAQLGLAVLAGIAVIVLLYAYPRRASWERVVSAAGGEAGEAGRAAKGTIA